MKLLSKIVWSEGMYLAPHHFQAQNRYFEDSVHFATANLWRHAFGFAELQIDADALKIGTVAILAARGIFQDGLTFDIPVSDPAPAPLEFAAQFPPHAESLTVALCVPEFVSHGANCTLNGDSSGALRYTGVVNVFADENTGYDEKEVRVGRKNVRLVVQNDSQPAGIALPVCRIVRDGSGHFEVDPSFMAPSVHLNVNDSMTGLLKRLVEILETKSAAVSQEQVQSGRFQRSMSERNVAQFWFLHSVNSSLAELRHLLLSKHGHPEELFCALSRLAGALCTFDVDAHPRSLPKYDHMDPGGCFQILDHEIRRLLELNVPTQGIPIPLKPMNRYFHMGEVKDERCLARSRWILSIYSPVGEADLIQRVTQLVKVCSAKYVAKLVERALPGLSLTHLQIPPSSISAKVDHQYFSISLAGPCWESIVASRGVGVYVPGELPSPEVELTVLLEG
ncbi:MAG: type VI secretion system baseplate subunit TssK [Candidatus Korobacteraceae bacterium]